MLWPKMDVSRLNIASLRWSCYAKNVRGMNAPSHTERERSFRSIQALCCVTMAHLILRASSRQSTSRSVRCHCSKRLCLQKLCHLRLWEVGDIT